MSAEAVIFSTLTGFVSGRVYPDVAPAESALPRIVYQQVGGQEEAYLEGTLPDKENGRFQISSWATTRLAAINLAKQARGAIVASTAFQASPIGARVSIYEPDTGLFCSRQDFSVWSTS